MPRRIRPARGEAAAAARQRERAARAKLAAIRAESARIEQVAAIQQSRRPRGHWPAGKLRVTPVARDVIERIRAATADRAVGRSRCALARHLGVSVRTVSRWLSGEDALRVEYAARIEIWLSTVEGDGNV